MNNLQRFPVALLIAGFTGAFSSFTPGFAQEKAPAVQATVTQDMAEGEIRKIDPNAKKVTLRHGEIKSLEMPPMTMVFQVKDLALVEGFKVGDKVIFAAEKQEGGFFVTALQAKP